MRIQRSRLAVSLGLSLGIVLNGAAATHFVDLSCTNPVPPYSTWATAATNIQDAVITASFLDTVLVTNGIYQYAGISASGPNRVEINAPILLQSVNGPAVTVIKGYQVPGATNGPSAVRCVYLGNGGTLSGFTLTNGATANPGSGGGVYCQFTNCLVTNCVITGNAANNGGGGAFSGTLVNCSLIGNSASPLIFGNGGGAYQSTLVNCLLTRNFAGYSGGAAIYCTLINCTVVSNSIAAYKSSLEGGTVKNSIVYYNFIAYTNADTGSPSVFSNCCVSFTPPFGANNFTNPPLFADLSGGDFHLQTNSPCINAGNNSFIASGTDLDGNPRIAGGTVDIGAYEYQNPVSRISYAWLLQFGLPIAANTDVADPDGDAMNNYQEWIAGTDPNSASSVLKLLTPDVSMSAVNVSWQSVSNRTYLLERSSNLAAQPVFSAVHSNIVGQAGTTSFQDLTATNGGPYFYRVGVH